MIDTPAARFAINAVRQVSRLVRLVQRQMTSPAMAKDDLSPVTVGDFAAQAVVGSLLEAAYPSATLVGEESAAELRRPESADALAQVVTFVRGAIPSATQEQVLAWIDRGAGEAQGSFWTLDPIDGTKGFLRGEQYAVALALVNDGVVEIGVLGCPNLNPRGASEPGGAGAIFVAARGAGTWAATIDGADSELFNRVRVSERKQPRDARFLRSVEASHTDGGKIEQLAKLLRVEAEPVRMDSQAKYAVLAAGGGELVLRLLSPSRPDYREKIWDQAAGSIIVEEAGGQVSDLAGKPFDFRHGRELKQNRGVVVSNAHLHAEIIRGLAEIDA